MRTSELRTILLAASFAVFATAAGAAPPAYIQSCADCHGNNGISADGKFPTIAGMSAFYLEGQIEAYQKGQRPCPKTSDPVKKAETDMCDIAKKLTPDQVKETAEFFAAQKFVAAQQPVDATLAAKGKSIHDAHCEICHSDGGSQAIDDAGILAGQWKPYLVTTLAEYHDGKRIEPEKMKPQTKALSADDIKALAEFYAGEESK
ncbi:MAG: c-type cytochrome [Gammaproteobacteria bacterium]|nr:c-type cytochrome [Gammaproteobacteria bacterium]